MPKVINLKNVKGFQVLITEEHSQAAALTLSPGEATSKEQNKHPASEQTLLVLEGTLRAEIEDQVHEMREGDMVLIPKNTRHRFVNNGEATARAFSTYAPPVY